MADLGSIMLQRRALDQQRDFQQRNFMQDMEQERQKREEQTARLTAAGKSADAFAQAVPEFLKTLGTDEKEWKTLGAREKAAAMEGFVTAQKFNEFKAKLHDYAQQEAVAKAQLADYDTKGKVAQDFGGFTRELPGASRMSPTDQRLAPYYEADANEMPEPPTRPLNEYVPEVASRFPMANQHNNFNDFVKLLQTSREQGNAIPGTLMPVPGREDLKFGVQSPTGAGTFLNTPKPPPAEGAEATPILMNGQPTGWAKFPDGTARRLPKTKDETDFSTFDTDSDGILSSAEFANAIVAEKLGGAFPGMKVKKPGEKPAAEVKAVGGYKIGTVYGGLRYKGGDPNKEANWEKAR